MTSNKSNRKKKDNKNSILFIIFTALLIDILAFTIILPLYPRLLLAYENNKENDWLFTLIQSYIHQFEVFIGARSFASGSNTNEMRNSRLDIILFGGVLGSMFSFLQFISSPWIGSWSDRYGRKPILMWSMLGNFLSMLIWCFADQFSIFVLSRIVGGLTEGNVQMSIAMITDVTEEKSRSKGMALVGIAFALGFTFGPSLGAFFSHMEVGNVLPGWIREKLPFHSYSGPAVFAVLLILIESVYMALYLPETKNYFSVSQMDDKRNEKKSNRNFNTDSTGGHVIVSSDSTNSPKLLIKRANKTKYVETNDDKKKMTDHQEAERDNDNNKNNSLGDKVFNQDSKSTTYSSNTSENSQDNNNNNKNKTKLKEDKIHFDKLCKLHFLFLFVFSGMEFTLTFLTHDRFQYTNTQQGMLLGFMGVMSALIQGGYVRRVKNQQEHKILKQGLVSCVVGLLILCISYRPLMLYLGVLFLAFTSGSVVNILNSIASKSFVNDHGNNHDDGANGKGTKENYSSRQLKSHTNNNNKKENVGQVMGKFRSVGQLGRTLGPFFACCCYWLLSSEWCYALGATGVGLCFMILIS